MLAGLCHDLDHPGFNNNFVSLSKHPLAHMYKSSMLEYHHYYMAKKIIEVTLLKNPLLCDSFADIIPIRTKKHKILRSITLQDKNLLVKLSIADRDRILQEIKFNILCTDLAVYFQVDIC